MKKFEVQLACFGASFDFELSHRCVKLPDCGDVVYYWMDSRRLRRGECRNYRACTDSWWAAMESADLTHHLRNRDSDRERDVDANQMTLVLAEIYPHLCRSKGQQSVFYDAVPRPGTVRAWAPSQDLGGPPVALDPEEADRLRGIARRRGVEGVRAVIREAFAGELPRGNERQVLNSDFNRLIDAGITALERGGRENLRQHIRDVVVPGLARQRRRGGQPAAKTRFLNLLAYNSKIAFYTSFANAWGLLIPWLREHRGLDVVSERLLRLWHCRRRRVDENDVFWGQTLSLHPISILLMTQPEHLLNLARYLKSVSTVGRDTPIDDVENPAYWELVGSILVACRERGALRMQQEAARRKKPLSAPNRLEAGRDEAPSSLIENIEDYLAERQRTCSACGEGRLTVKSGAVSKLESKLAAEVQCRACETTTTIEISLDQTTSAEGSD